MVRTRVMIGGSLIAGFLVLALADRALAGGPLLHVIVCALVICAMVEFYDLAEQGGHHPHKLLGIVVAGGLVALQFCFGRTADPFHQAVTGAPPGALRAGYPFLAIGAGFGLLVLAVGVLVREEVERYLGSLMVTALGLFYVWFLAAHVLAIRIGWGVGCVVAFVAVAKLCDVGAYFAGKYLGRHKLAPRISPNKTIEGAIAGLVVSTFAGLVLGRMLAGRDLGPAFWTVFGLVVGLAAQAGDLVESAIKRSLGVKDSSRLLPTYGGILDVMDSLLVSAPVALWLLEFWGRRILQGG